MQKRCFDEVLLEALRSDKTSVTAFKVIFHIHHSQVVANAKFRCYDNEMALQIAQDVFVELWHDRKKNFAPELLPLAPDVFKELWTEKRKEDPPILILYFIRGIDIAFRRRLAA
ncbi:sigma-70 family RNA polymerase sigma factor [Dinghuibacter silviterrae]|uniref:Uncharacterized protein n=1 Tax=Dinghuibacter silviterrae TaxID=1539049 RepID=A0A4R8DST0_9BACT|nr:hypothetical protein [Dinghuibacter silviterrae]TDX00465.1 hypothetical protein EDB95_1490 [Dinghuibacter silviterrae]